MLERTSTPISLPKKKRPASSWWVGLTGDGKAWRWRHHRQVEPTGKRIHLPRLGGWHLWDLVTTFFRGNVWMNIFGFWPQVGGVTSSESQTTKREMFGSSGWKWFSVLHSHLHRIRIRSNTLLALWQFFCHLQTYHTTAIYIQTIHHTCVYHVNKMYSTTVRYDCNILL